MSYSTAIEIAEKSNEPLVINSLVDQVQRIAKVTKLSGIPCDFEVKDDIVFVECKPENINRTIALDDDDAISRLTILLSDLQLATPVCAAMIQTH